MLLVAITWRYRDRRRVAGVALGGALALKFFLWPVVLWLVAAAGEGRARRGRPSPPRRCSCSCRSSASSTTSGCCGSSATTFDGLSYTPYALLVDLGARPRSRGPSRSLLGPAVLALAWRRRSLGLALAAALCLSPIVWRHFFALLVVPLALSRPRFDSSGSYRSACGSGRDVQRGDVADRCGPRLARSRSSSARPDGSTTPSCVPGTRRPAPRCLAEPDTFPDISRCLASARHLTSPPAFGHSDAGRVRLQSDTSPRDEIARARRGRKGVGLKSDTGHEARHPSLYA